MKHLALALAVLVPLAAGCNTAQLNVPPTPDGGTAVCDLTPEFSSCDGGNPEAGAPCDGQPDAAIPPGAYPVQCLATSHHYDPAGECAIQYQCTCSPRPNGGASYWACAH
jgi:hypothetical protein